MKKKIGIVYSPGFGAGWASWGEDGQALDQELALAIEEKQPYENIAAIAEKNWPDAYQGGLDDCTVKWVDEGTMFFIEEYDGSESLRLRDDGDIWQVAK